MTLQAAAWRVRLMTLDDHDEVHALWSASAGVGLSDADGRDGVAAFLARNPGLSFVAVAGGRIAGAVLCGHDGRRGFIHHLAVDAAHRRRGIGRELVRRALAGLERASIQKCHLFVFRQNRGALAFWRRAGFVERVELHMLSSEVPGGGSGPSRR